SRFMGLDEPAALARLLAWHVAALLVTELHARAGRQPLDRLGEGEVFHFLDEPDDVAAGPARETEVELFTWRHIERRRFLVMERAQSLERAAAGAAQLQVLPHHVDDGRPLADRRDVLLTNTTRHVTSIGSEESYKLAYERVGGECRVSDLLVLWDLDGTLLNAGGGGGELSAPGVGQLFGQPPDALAPMAGRTDRAIILQTLELAGIAEPRQHLDPFIAGLTARAPSVREEIALRGRALPGALAALAALAALSSGRGGGASGLGGGASGRGRRVHQSVLTGNIRPVAEVKLAAL